MNGLSRRTFVARTAAALGGAALSGTGMADASGKVRSEVETQVSPESMAGVTFPKDFLWGTATAAFQVEGAWNEVRAYAGKDSRRGDGRCGVRPLPSLSGRSAAVQADEFEELPVFDLMAADPAER